MVLLFTFLSQFLWAIPEIKNWDYVRSDNQVYTYRFSDNSKVLGVFHEEANKKRLNWKKITSQQFFESVEEQKRELMKMINITNWKVDDRLWNKRKGYFELQIKGSYRDKDNKKVLFQENHFYFPRKTQQVLLTSTNTQLLGPKPMSDFIFQARSVLDKK